MRHKPFRYFKLRFFKRRKLIMVFIAILIGFVLSMLIYNSLFPQNGIKILKSKAESDVSLTVSQIIDKYLSDNNGKMTKILTSLRNENGEIILYRTDTTQIEKAKHEITEKVANGLERNSRVDSKVRLGTLTGNGYLVGKGINVTIHGNLVSAVTSEVQTETNSLGINQALHKVKIIIVVDCKLFAAGECEAFSVTTEHIISERLIFGEVPLA